MSQQITSSVRSSTLADVLERVLDKGVVIAGDIKIKLVDIELLTIQVRLVISSVEKARELGMDWWTRNPQFCSSASDSQQKQELEDLRRQVAALEGRLDAPSPGHAGRTEAGEELATLGMPPRITALLEGAGIRSVEALARKSPLELRAIRGLGGASITRIQRALARTCTDRPCRTPGAAR